MKINPTVQSIALAGANKVVTLAMTDMHGQPVLKDGQPQPGKLVIDAVRVEISMTVLQGLIGKLVYIRGLQVPVIDTKQPVILEVVDFETDEPFARLGAGKTIAIHGQSFHVQAVTPEKLKETP